MITTWGLLVRKQEMTKVWVEGRQIPVTLLKIVPQEIIRHKTIEKDGYNALVLWGEKTQKNTTTQYTHVSEIKVIPESLEKYSVWSSLTSSLLDGFSTVRVMWISKGKGFQSDDLREIENQEELSSDGKWLDVCEVRK